MFKVKSYLLKGILYIAILGLWYPPLLAQYKISSNERLVVSDMTETQSKSDARIIAQQFFDLAFKGDLSSWEKILSRRCLKEDNPSAMAQDWYVQIMQSKNKYKIIGEGPSPRNNQKIYYFSETWPTDSVQNNQMILIKEKGSWKVLYAKL